MGQLDGKVILLTGGAGDIGSALARAIRRENGTALVTDLPGRGELDHALDVTSEGEWSRLAQIVSASHGALDGLVHAAGIGILGTVEECDFETWRKTMAVNLDGPFLGCKYLFPLLRQRGGSIVNISSVSGLVGGHNLAAYNASKGGLRLLSKSIALHGARCDPPVRCNSVHPAFIEGRMVDAIGAQSQDSQRALSRMAKDIPLRRFGLPEEVAEMCVYLLSDAAAFVTGAEFVIDGGLTAR